VWSYIEIVTSIRHKWLLLTETIRREYLDAYIPSIFKIKWVLWPRRKIVESSIRQEKKDLMTYWSDKGSSHYFLFFIKTAQNNLFLSFIFSYQFSKCKTQEDRQRIPLTILFLNLVTVQLKNKIFYKYL
jgi:hypothetical protein